MLGGCFASDAGVGPVVVVGVVPGEDPHGIGSLVLHGLCFRYPHPNTPVTRNTIIHRCILITSLVQATMRP